MYTYTHIYTDAYIDAHAHIYVFSPDSQSCPSLSPEQHLPQEAPQLQIHHRFPSHYTYLYTHPAQ